VSGEIDRSRLRTVPIAGRRSRVDASLLASLPDGELSVSAFLSSLPDQLAARDLRSVILALAAAHRDGKGVIFLLGGHVVKVGLGPLVARLVERGIVTHVALNGAAAIHDFELAAYGSTSEDVASGLADGTFGMVEETGHDMNQAIAQAAAAGIGMGAGLAEALAARPDPPGASASILLAAHRTGTPVTAHPAIGAEIIHQHPHANGSAIGATGLRDFDRLAASMPTLDEGGVVINWGSAVMMPEVFLKALTVARNLNGGRPRRIFAADFDMIRHYRPAMNVVRRPTEGGGTGVEITGHHEIMMPLVVWGVEGLLAETRPRSAGP
jgi:hypothetical protein